VLGNPRKETKRQKKGGVETHTVVGMSKSEEREERR